MEANLDELLTRKYINFNHDEIYLRMRVSKPMVLMPVAEAKAAIERLIADEARKAEARVKAEYSSVIGYFDEETLAAIKKLDLRGDGSQLSNKAQLEREEV